MIVNDGTGGSLAAKTADATAAAADIISPKTAYVNGEKVTGTLVEQNAALYKDDDVKMTFASSTGKVLFQHSLTNRICVKAKASIGLAAQASRFGDATAGDVAAGKTFTSAAGLNVMGTLEIPPEGAVAFRTKMVRTASVTKNTLMNGVEVQRITFDTYATSVDVHCEYERRFAAPDCTLFMAYGSGRLEYSQANAKGTWFSTSDNVPCTFALEGDELVMRINCDMTLTNSIVSNGSLKGPALLYASCYTDAYTIEE